MAKPLSIIYDGQCGFCIRILNLFRRVDLKSALAFYDSHLRTTLERFPQLRHADLADAMYTIAEDEAPYQGFYSFRRILWVSPLMWPMLPLFYFPGVSFLGERIYAWVARNRKNFGCASSSCELPAATSEAGTRHNK